MSDIKWIKLAVDVFDNRKIRLIEALPDGDTLVVIWFKLLCLAGNTNDNGDIYFSEEVPYTEEMLATLFNKALPTVRLAITTFQKFGMIEVIDDIIHISNWEKYQNIEEMARIREQTRQRVAKHRERQKLGCNVTSNVTVTQCNATDIDIDKDIKETLPNGNVKKNTAGNYELFDKFWEAYPKKKDKKSAIKAFQKLKCDDGLFEKIMSALEAQKKSEQWTRDGGQFIPYPATWLNGERWEDEIEASIPKPEKKKYTDGLHINTGGSHG